MRKICCIFLSKFHFDVFCSCLGLKPGDRWALCATRWYEAFTAGSAPLVKLDATHRKALETIPLETLEQFDDRRLNPANINTTGRDEL
jgi:uncharacterized protein (DUF2237 family)